MKLTKQPGINQTNSKRKIMLLAIVGLLMCYSYAQHNFKSAEVKRRNLEPACGPNSSSAGRPETLNSLHGAGMRFTPNQGQIADMNGKLRPDVLYKGDGGGADIYLRKTGISYVFSNMDEVMHEVHEKVEEIEHSKEGLEGKTGGEWEQELMQKESIKIHQVDMDFEGANKNIKIINEDEIDGYNNYYYAHLPIRQAGCPNAVLNVKQYNKVTFKNIYKNIDVTYYASASLSTSGSSEKGIKYDLVVQPHADPGQIKLKWSGAENIHINREGHLVIKTSVNEFTESIPKVYQIINGKVIDVAAVYKLSANGIVSFSFARPDEPFGPGDGWDEAFPLIIDPWVTYYGGTGIDYGNNITTDASGNVYMAGQTYSNAGIAAVGFQTVYGGGGDAFLVKFNDVGIRIWATYYGGANMENSKSIATDAFGNVYLAGYTGGSTTGIASGGFQNILGGSYDAFLVKFDGTGTRLWATYYGGTGNDYGNSVATDASGNVYMAGYTRSTASIASGGFQNVLKGFDDAFLVKFDGTGTRLWATYYGGTGNDYGNSVTTASGNVYLAGRTNSPADISAGGFQNIFGGIYDAFLVKFDGAGIRLWATYYGEMANEYGNSVATDALGNVYLAGMTGSTAGIAAGGFQNTFGGTYDAFLVKFDGAGSRLWASYLGGMDQDYAVSVAVDQLTNDVYVSGDTYSLNFPVTDCAWQQTLGGGISEDGFVSHFDQTGKIVCSSYVGGPAAPNDEECHIALYGCYVYMTGYTGGSYPVTPGAHQTVFGGGGTWDAFVAQLYKNSCGFNNTAVLAASANTSTVCTNIPLNFTGNFSVSCDNSAVNYSWSFPSGTPAVSANQNPTGIVYTTPGNYTVQLKAKTTCDSSTKNINITIEACTTCNLTGEFAKGTANCTGCGCKEWILVTATGGTSPYTYTWPDGYVNRYKNQLCPGAYNVNIKDKNGCSINVNITAP